MTNLRALKSGTDVRGKALGEGAPLTAAVAGRIGGAFVAWLRQRGVDNPRIALGRDSRLTGEMLLDGCAEDDASVRHDGHRRLVSCMAGQSYRGATVSTDLVDVLAAFPV